MIERLRREVELVRARYGVLRLAPELTWLIIERWPLPPGWNKTEIRLLIQIPPGYPVTPPDNFWTDDDLCLAGGGEPGNVMGFIELDERRWRQFSYHAATAEWQPHAEPTRGHNLLTFLEAVAERLQEGS